MCRVLRKKPNPDVSIAEFCQGLRKDLRFGFCPLRVEQDLHLFGHAWHLDAMFLFELTLQMIFFRVYVHPYLGKIPMLTNIFQRAWNHQLGCFSGFAFFSDTSGPHISSNWLAPWWNSRNLQAQVRNRNSYCCTPGKLTARTWEYTPGKGKSSSNPSFIKFYIYQSWVFCWNVSISMMFSRLNQQQDDLQFPGDFLLVGDRPAVFHHLRPPNLNFGQRKAFVMVIQGPKKTRLDCFFYQHFFGGELVNWWVKKTTKVRLKSFNHSFGLGFSTTESISIAMTCFIQEYMAPELLDFPHEHDEKVSRVKIKLL